MKKLTLLLCLLLGVLPRAQADSCIDPEIISLVTISTCAISYLAKNLYEKYQREYEERQREYFFEKFSYDASEKHPELYEVFLKIKANMSIKEKVDLRILSKEFMNPQEKGDVRILNKILADMNRNKEQVGGMYRNNRVYLGDSFVSHSCNAVIVHVLVHELEHYRQYHHYPGSIPGLTDRIGIEFGADKAAAEYQCCSCCLKDVAKARFCPYDPCTTKSGVYPTKQGYFAKESYEPYIRRAQAAHARCPAHKNSIFCIYCSAKTPLKDFLPTVRK